MKRFAVIIALVLLGQASIAEEWIGDAKCGVLLAYDERPDLFRPAAGAFLSAYLSGASIGPVNEFYVLIEFRNICHQNPDTTIAVGLGKAREIAEMKRQN